MSKPIAIIGMGSLFPKAENLREYWNNIVQGVDAIGEIPSTHWSADDYFDGDSSRADFTYAKRGGFLSPYPFDPLSFGVPPSSLEATDTSQLLGLVVAKAALEDAGYGENREFNRDKVSVILGVTGAMELVIPLGARLGHPIWRKALREAGLSEAKTQEVVDRISNGYVPWQENSFPGLLGNVVAGRIANRLNLGGTNCVVDAACASSLSAAHLAILELSEGRSDMVLTGGVDTFNDIFMYMCFSKTPALSPTGDARPFDESADGTILGEGIGMVVLKRLEDAERDGDRIYAVIRGLGSSSDGRSKSIYAPRPEGQAKALNAAYAQAEIDPSSVELLEAHGTGTKAGDAAEIESLRRVYSETSQGPWCALGSVKSQIGHTKAAAGAAGLIKAALALHHKVLPPTLKIKTPSQKLALKSSPFYLNTVARPWAPRAEHPRRAAVSAFGFGGSNFHAVLEEYRGERTEIAWDAKQELFALSATTSAGIEAALADIQKLSSPERARAARQSRETFQSSHPYRLVFAVDLSLEPEKVLKSVASQVARNSATSWELAEGVFFGVGRVQGKTAFLFPGQGSQYLAMGQELVCTFPFAQKSLEAFGSQVSAKIFPQPAFQDGERKLQAEQLTSTDIAQPALGAISAAWLSVLEHFGVRADVAGGHSFGELTALFAAGRFDLATFVSLAASRGLAMKNAGEKSVDSGAMLAVSAPVPALETLLTEHKLDLVIANRNTYDQCVLSGRVSEIERAMDLVKTRGWGAKRLSVSAAFHSPLVASASVSFGEQVNSHSWLKGRMPVVSNTTGAEYPSESNAAASLLAEQLAQPVNFVALVNNLFESGVRSFIEIGPKTVLGSLVRAILQNRTGDKNYQVLSCDASSGRSRVLNDLARLLAQLSASGHDVALSKWQKALNPLTSPSLEAPPPKMTVMISGANLRTTPIKSITKVKESQESITHESTPMSTRIPPSSSTSVPSSTESSLERGLKALLELNLQTAALHKKFLEGQEAAQLAYLKFFEENTRGAALSPSQARLVPEVAARVAVVAPVEAAVPVEVAAPVTMPVSAQEASAAVSSISAAIPGVDRKTLEQVLLSVVADKTGYPAETLELSMDLESDLGIDSIKRVEILAGVRERIPEAPSVEPEHLGSLRTLGQIVDFIFSKANSEAALFVSAPAAATVAASVTTPAGVDSAVLEAALLKVVADKTGYPIDTLELDMDLESDLGIDSIKRVEILAGVREEIPEAPSVEPEHLGSLRTLRQIVQFILDKSSAIAAPVSFVSIPTASAVSPASALSSGPVVEMSASKVPEPEAILVVEEAKILDRQVLELSPLPTFAGSQPRIAAGHCVLISNDDEDLAEQLAARFLQAGIPAEICDLKNMPAQGQRPIGAFVILAAPTLSSESAWSLDCEQFLKNAFLATQQVAVDLKAASRQEGGAFFATVSRMDGAFGLSGEDLSSINPVQGGLAGLSKTVALEWTQIRVRALDVSPQWRGTSVADAIFQELSESTPIEVALTPKGRHGLVSRSSPLKIEQASWAAEMPSVRPMGGVYIVTGGARGVTREAALALAKVGNPTIVLMGRSAMPVKEADWSTPLKTEAEIKKALAQRSAAAGEKPNPRAMGLETKRIMANREVLKALDELSAFATVHYRSVDMRNPELVQQRLAEVRSTIGPISGIVHGAGLLEDRLIEDKSLAQFEAVFDTKVGGLRALLDATETDTLQFLALFSSISGRLGRRGQVDYSIANEVLNKVARREASRRPNACIVALNWGPWDGGMVGPELSREFAKEGIPLIPLKAGAAAFLSEVFSTQTSPVEVILGGPRDLSLSAEISGSTFKKTLHLSQNPFLHSHVLGGRPVLPLAVMMEYFSGAGLQYHPGLKFLGLGDLRVFRAVSFENETVELSVLKIQSSEHTDQTRVLLELRSGPQAEILHARGMVMLGLAEFEAPTIALDSVEHRNVYPHVLEDAYEKFLFHGPHFQGIRKVLGISDRGISAVVSRAPAPSKWTEESASQEWHSDPLVLDSAFQLAILWCQEILLAPSLPARFESYQQFCAFPDDPELVVSFVIRDKASSRVKGDFFIYSPRSGASSETYSPALVPIAIIEGYECTVDAILTKAFMPSTVPGDSPVSGANSRI